MNPETFDKVPLNTCDFATSVLVAPPPATLPATTTPSISACICTYTAANCSCNCLMIKLCWLIVYGSSGDGDKDVRGGGVGKDCSWAKRTNFVLDSVSNSYSKLKISVGTSGLSSSPTLHWLLTCYNGYLENAT